MRQQLRRRIKGGMGNLVQPRLQVGRHPSGKSVHDMPVLHHFSPMMVLGQRRDQHRLNLAPQRVLKLGIALKPSFCTYRTTGGVDTNTAFASCVIDHRAAAG